MTELTHKGHRDRLRKRFLYEDLDHFEPHEVLEFVLYYSITQADTNPIAHDLLKHFGSFANVLDAPLEELQKVHGMGERSAVLLKLLPSVFRYYEQDKAKKTVTLGTAQDAGEFVKSLFIGRTTEAFGLVCLDSHRNVLYSGIISEGTTNRTNVYPRMVLQAVFKHNAQNVIFAHNHPNGSMSPSAEDKFLTQELIDALNKVDVNVIDHIIVSGSRHVSMCELGMMKN